MPINNNILAGSGQGSAGDVGEEITQSLRFNGGGFLTRGQNTPKLSTDRTFTFSTWFKHGSMGETNIFGIHSASGQDNWLLSFASFSNPSFAGRDISTSWGQYSSSASFRDPNAWYHLFLTCSSGVLSLRVNNVLQDQTDTQNHSMDRDFVIGAETASGGTPMTAYLAETYFFQGSVLHAENNHFIRQNEDGIWVPDTPTKTNGDAFTAADFGTNGWHLKYDPNGKAGQTGDGAGVGADHSPNNNHFTPSGFTAADTGFTDTPTSNHGTFNRLSTDNTISDGNLHSTASSFIFSPSGFAIPPNSGKFYWEVTMETVSGNQTIGACSPSAAPAGVAPTSSWVWAPDLEDIESPQGNIADLVDISVSTIGTAAGTVYMVAYDSNTQEFWVGDSGTFYKRDGAAGVGDPANGNNPFLTTSDNCVVSGETYCPCTAGSSAGTTSYFLNVGQKAFAHTAPAGFKALQTNNLPTPSIKNGRDHFGCVAYTGDGQPTQAITGLEFKPDLIWIKPRSVADNHRIIDSVRGKLTHLMPNTNDDEPASNAQIISSFDTNGFTLNGSDSGWNGNTSTYVAWCWKCNSTFTPSVTGVTSAVGKRNKTAGMSILTYTGNNTSGTITHGLDKAPEFILFKRRSVDDNWIAYHKSVGHTQALQLDGSPGGEAIPFNSTFLSNTAPTGPTGSPASTITLGGVSGNNGTGNFVAYCWHSVEGFSKFGEYTGNSDADGSFVYLGFKPKLVFIKRISGSTASWYGFDSARDEHNTMFRELHLNTAAMENTANENEAKIDFLSNGFKMRSNRVNYNASNRYIYMAWAENPFGGENAAPATAR